MSRLAGLSDKARSRPHHYVGYLVDEPKRRRRRPSLAGELGAGRVLFILQEQHFVTPPDWNLRCVVDPRAWFNSVITEIHVALAPVAPRPT